MFLYLYIYICLNAVIVQRRLLLYSYILCILLYDVNPSMVMDRKVITDQASHGTGKKQEDV